jgi:macrophage erythroblast attacher
LNLTNTYDEQLADLHQSAGSTTINVMRQRINHLSTIEHITHNDTPEFDEWANTRLNRWIVDWALRKGYTATAEKITSDKHLEVGAAIHVVG